MTTTRTFTATTGGRIFADLIIPIGQVNVTVDPTLANAIVTLTTGDDEGPIADAVREADSREYRHGTSDVLMVRVPEINGGTFTQINGVTFGGSSFTVAGGSVQVSGNVGSRVVISNGDVIVGGHRIVQNGRVVAETGTVVGGTIGTGTLTVDVRVRDLSSVRLHTTSADITVRGAVQLLDVTSISGDVEADTVHTLHAQTTSGDVEIGTVQARAEVTTVSGDLEIGAYEGSELRANTVSGDTHIAATSNATGSATITTVSGDITTRGADHLSLRPHTVSGKIRQR